MIGILKHTSLRVHESSMTRSRHHVIAFLPRCYLYNCKTRVSIKIVCIYLGYVSPVVSYRCSASPEYYFSFACFLFPSSRSPYRPFSLLLVDLSLQHDFSLPYFRSLSNSVVVTPCRQHLQRSSLFPLGCSEPFVMILGIRRGVGVATRNNPSLT